jgi:hypothetical protein
MLTRLQAQFTVVHVFIITEPHYISALRTFKQESHKSSPKQSGRGAREHRVETSQDQDQT